MPVWISGVISAVSSFFGSLFGAAKSFVLLYLARRSGRKEAEADAAIEAAKIIKKQRDAVTGRSVHREDIIKEMEDGKL